MQTYYIVLNGKQDKNEEKSEKVIDGLKKYNRNMFILKVIVVILSIFIVSIWGKFIANKIKEGIELKEIQEKGQYIFDIIEEAYKTLDNITNAGNYSITEESIGINYDLNLVYEYTTRKKFYKDGYFKEENIDNIENTQKNYSGYLSYGVEAKDKSVSVQVQVDDGSYCSMGMSLTQYDTMHGILEECHKENLLEYEYFEVREEVIDGKSYYIISKNIKEDDGVYYTEIWINKDNMQLYKVTDEKIGCKKTEIKFTLSVNDVKDEDVRVKFAGKDEKIQELDRFFEQINDNKLEDINRQLANWYSNKQMTKVFFDNYVKTNKKVITQDESTKIIEDKYGIESGYGYSYKGIIFDQNGDAYYVWRQFQGTDTFVRDIFVSILGDIIKTKDIDMDVENGDLVIL